MGGNSLARAETVWEEAEAVWAEMEEVWAGVEADWEGAATGSYMHEGKMHEGGKG